MENWHNQEPVLAHVLALAQYTGARVILAWLVPVLASGEQFFSQIQVEPGSSGARRKADGEEYLAQAVPLFRQAGVEVQARVVVTPLPPEQEIIRLATDNMIDLIVMATLPQSAVGRFLFGSVEDKVRRQSPVPVLFVNPSETGEGGA
jgi:nucleotide-binding universal stress UspA family protein